MKTPDEIKKGIECCIAMDCACTLRGCPYNGMRLCSDRLLKDARDLINQLEKQNRTLTETKESCEKRMIELAKQMPEWINARLPPTKWHLDDEEMTLANFLIYSPEFGVDVGNYLAPTKTWLLLGVPVKITHWMDITQLPVIPEEE